MNERDGTRHYFMLDEVLNPVQLASSNGWRAIAVRTTSIACSNSQSAAERNICDHTPV